jgi:histidinol-phosphatase (PHP family)
MTIDKTHDHHMHTLYSDGTCNIETLAIKAIERGLKTITITDHMPLPYPTRYTMDIHSIETYQNEIKKVRNRYKNQLNIQTGLEIEYIPQINPWIHDIASRDWEKLIASVHTFMVRETPYIINGRFEEFELLHVKIFKSDIKALCTKYYTTLQEAYKTGWFDYAGHLDVIKKHNTRNRFFDERDDWYQELVSQTLDELKAANMSLEINTAGWNHPINEPYPGKMIIDQAISKEIPLHLSSDSHQPDTLAQHFDRACELGRSVCKIADQ